MSIEMLLPKLKTGNYRIEELSDDLILYKIFIEGDEIYLTPDSKMCPIIPRGHEKSDKNYWITMVEKFEKLLTKNNVRVRVKGDKIIITGPKSFITNVEARLQRDMKLVRKSSRKIILEPNPFFAWLPRTYNVLEVVHKKLEEEKSRNDERKRLRTIGMVLMKYFDVEKIYIDTQRSRVTVKTKNFKLVIEDMEHSVHYRVYTDDLEGLADYLIENYNWVEVDGKYTAFFEAIHDYVLYIIDRDICDDDSIFIVTEFFAKVLKEYFDQKRE